MRTTNTAVPGIAEREEPTDIAARATVAVIGLEISAATVTDGPTAREARVAGAAEKTAAATTNPNRLLHLADFTDGRVFGHAALFELALGILPGASLRCGERQQCQAYESTHVPSHASHDALPIWSIRPLSDGYPVPTRVVVARRLDDHNLLSAVGDHRPSE